MDLAKVTGDAVAGQDLAHFRLLLGAAREGVGATGVKAAAGRRVERARHVAFEDDALLGRLGAPSADCPLQS